MVDVTVCDTSFMPDREGARRFGLSTSVNGPVIQVPVWRKKWFWTVPFWFIDGLAALGPACV